MIVCVEGMSMGTMWLLYAGFGAASAVAILGLIGLAYLLKTSFTKGGKNNSDDADLHIYGQQHS